MSFYPTMGSGSGGGGGRGGGGVNGYGGPQQFGYHPSLGAHAPEPHTLPDPGTTKRPWINPTPHQLPVSQYSYPSNDHSKGYYPSLDAYGSASNVQPPLASTHQFQQTQAQAQAQAQFQAQAQAQAQHHQNLEHQLLVAHQLAKLTQQPQPTGAWPQPAQQVSHVAQDKYWPTNLNDMRATPPTTTRHIPSNAAAQVGSGICSNPMPGQQGWTWEGRTSWLAPVIAPLFLQLSEAFQDVVGTRHVEAAGFGEMLSPASKAVVQMAPAPQPSSYAVANDRTYNGRVYESLQADSLYATGASWPGSTARDDGGHTTHLTMETFTNFVQTVLQQPIITPTTLFLSLFYALRLYRLLADEGPSECDAENEAEAEVSDELRYDTHQGEANQAVIVQSWKNEFRTTFMTPSTSLPFKLFVLGLMMGNKHLDDNTFLNKTWTEVTGIPLAELNTLERFYLRITHFDLVPPLEEWVSYLHDMEYFVSRRLIESYDYHDGTETIDAALRMNEVGPDQFRWVLAALEEEFPRDHALPSHATQPRSSSVISYLPAHETQGSGGGMYDSPTLASRSSESDHSVVDSLNASPYRGFQALSPEQRYEDQSSPMSSSSSPSLDSHTGAPVPSVDRVHVVGSGSVPLAQANEWKEPQYLPPGPSQQLHAHAQAQAQAQMDWYNYHYGPYAAHAHVQAQAQAQAHAQAQAQAQAQVQAHAQHAPSAYPYTGMNGMGYPYPSYGYGHQGMHGTHHVPIAGL